MTNNTIKNRIAKVEKELSHCDGVVKQREKLLELGFEYFDDEEQDTDDIEEQVAEPKNGRQCKLIAYFNGDEVPSLDILDEFLAEKWSNDKTIP